MVITELLRLVGITLAEAPLDTCAAGDVDRSGTITVDEVILGVNNALRGCIPD